ncbi:uncharacterized protein LOC116160029 isoform X1 [Photinus pyralis]|nr:uncharacterized protein LOC116160029 isoform X1 [Photinus pyralis]
MIVIPANDLQGSLINTSTTSYHHDITDSYDMFQPSTSKKTRSEDSFLFPSTLENLLKMHVDGKIIMAHKHKLNNDDRQKLAKIVVNQIISTHNYAEIRADTFLEAAKEIINLFPTEKIETYYIPYSPPKGSLRRQPARGKLWSRYVNVRAALRLADKYKVTDENKENLVLEEENDKYEHDLAFLKVAVEPQQRVAQCWESTFRIRQKRYKSEPIETYFEAFPSLKLQFGIELLEIDFNTLHPNKANIIYENWPSVSKAILSEAKERKIIIEERNEDLSTSALLCLPYLFSPTTVKNSSKNKIGNWRPSRLEVQHSFFFCTKNLLELEEIVDARQHKLEKYQLPLQPFGVAVGDVGQESYYVYNQNIKYKLESSIRCLELLYKLFHALNLNYPAESKSIWQFIEEVVYGMPVTGKTSSAASAIADINYHLKL